MRGRSISVLVTFASDVPRNEIYDYFDTFGKEIWVTEIQNIMMKRYTVDCPEEKVREYAAKFKSSPDVLSALVNEHEMNRPKPTYRSDKKTAEKTQPKSK